MAFVIKRLSGFIVGLALGAAAPTIAQEVAVRCQPEVTKPKIACGNGLEPFFAHGYLPNRCRIS